MSPIDLSSVPTDQLIAELRGRVTGAMDIMSAVFAMTASATAAVLEGTSPTTESRDIPTPPPRAPEPLYPQVTVLPLSPRESNRPTFARAAKAGLYVPGSKTDADLKPNHFQPAPTPARMTAVQKDRMKAVVWANVADPAFDQTLAELDTSRPDLAKELRRGTRDINLIGSGAPSLSSIVAANQRNSADAFIQRVAPPSLANCVAAPAVTGIEWFDNPTLVHISLVDLLPAQTDLSAFETLRRTVKIAIADMLTSGFVGHLPSPVVRLERDDTLSVLLEPVVLWRLTMHLLPRLTDKRQETAFLGVLNIFIRDLVAEDQRVLFPECAVATDAPSAFRSEITQKLMGWMGDAETDNKPKIAQALKRQIRILNTSLQEKAIPNEREANARKLSDPRTLWDSEMGQDIGTRIGKRRTTALVLPATASDADVEAYNVDAQEVGD